MKIVIGNTGHRGFWGFVAQFVVLTLALLIAAYVVHDVHIGNVWTALLTGFVISLLNRFVKPILILLTFPFTAMTLGLFLFVINAVIVMLASVIVPQFEVDGFGTALLFSILLTLLNFLLELPDRIGNRTERQGTQEQEEHFDSYEEVENE